MKSWSVWMAAVMLGGLLGWVSGSWSSQRVTTTSLPLLDISPAAATPPGRLSPPDTLAEKSPPPPRSTTTTPPAGHAASVRAVIERELPHATADERDIWFEQLKELPPGVVEDLLNVRKQFRELVPPLTPHGLTGPMSLGPASPLWPRSLPADPTWQPGFEAVEQLRQVTLHNLANADTVGYRRLEPQLETDAGRHGIRWLGTRLDLRQGPIRRTQRQLDVALDGIGWFAVEEGDKIMVTRRGAFTVRDGHLALPLGADRYGPVLPIIAVPDGMLRVEITSTGEVGGWSKDAQTPQMLGQLEVALLSDAGLTALDAGQSVTANALVFARPGTVGVAPLVTMSLEQSNVQVDEERARLRWIDEWRQHVGPAAGAALSVAEPGSTR